MRVLMHLANPTRNVRCIALAALFIVLNGIAQTAPAATPSFLCGKTQSWVEKIICDNDALSSQDLQLASDYARLLDKLAADAAKQLAAEQRAWWASREECRDAGDPVVCLWAKYEARITALRVRPDFPPDSERPRTEVVETNVKEGASGWAKGLSDYVRAIRACLPLAPVEVAAVESAWPEQEGKDIAMRLLATNEETWICVARRDGSHVVGLRQKFPEEKLPEPGPYLYIGTAPPKARCGAIQVVDVNDQPVGWLANRLCE